MRFIISNFHMQTHAVTVSKHSLNSFFLMTCIILALVDHISYCKL
jgi:hypothetical protein